MINGIFLCILFVVLLIVVMVSFSGRPPSVAEGPTLMLDLGGEIAERNPVNVPAVFLQRGMKPSLKDSHDIAAEGRRGQARQWHRAQARRAGCGVGQGAS